MKRVFKIQLRINDTPFSLVPWKTKFFGLNGNFGWLCFAVDIGFYKEIGK